jgi:flagellar biosynthesis protein FlhF
MKIKRFMARNMREAIRMVRDEQGPDAVILSNSRVGNEIEVVAAVDYDAALMHQAVRHEIRRSGAQIPSSAPAQAGMAAARVQPPAPAPARASRAQSPVPTPPPAPVATAAARDPEITRLREDFSGMRRLLEQQLSGVLWNGMKTAQPERVSALNVLSDLGLDPELARQIAGELPEYSDADRARFLPLGLLSRRIPIVRKDPVLAGGAIALIGPTGVGKTTTLAKLASHFAMHHGTRDIALVTTDHYRIGAQEQLFTYGRLLGIPVHTASNAAELAQVMQKLSDRRLVLIDTAGMGPRDRNLAAQFSELKGVSGRISTYLVMAANSQASDLDEVVRRFGATPLDGGILTKLDESTRIGGALSVVIRSQLPLAFVTDGQRVPEDIQAARADRLVLRAMQMARQHPMVLDDSTLAMRFGGFGKNTQQEVIHVAG